MFDGHNLRRRIWKCFSDDEVCSLYWFGFICFYTFENVTCLHKTRIYKFYVVHAYEYLTISTNLRCRREKCSDYSRVGAWRRKIGNGTVLGLELGEGTMVMMKVSSMEFGDGKVVPELGGARARKKLQVDLENGCEVCSPSQMNSWIPHLFTTCGISSQL